MRATIQAQAARMSSTLADNVTSLAEAYRQSLRGRFLIFIVYMHNAICMLAGTLLQLLLSLMFTQSST